MWDLQKIRKHKQAQLHSSKAGCNFWSFWMLFCLLSQPYLHKPSGQGTEAGDVECRELELHLRGTNQSIAHEGLENTEAWKMLKKVDLITIKSYFCSIFPNRYGCKVAVLNSIFKQDQAVPTASKTERKQVIIQVPKVHLQSKENYIHFMNKLYKKWQMLAKS